MNPQRVELLLADDHDVVRTGMRSLLESREDWHVCGEASNGEEAVRLAAELRPDIAVIDMEMGGLDGVAVTRLIKENHPPTEVLIFTMHDNESLIREALSAGARTFVLKTEGIRTLMKAIEFALEHQSFFPPRASEILHNRFAKSGEKAGESSALTTRQREIVRLLASGRSNKEAAGDLGISVKTVETHRAAIMRKLGFNSMASLVRYALRERFIKA